MNQANPARTRKSLVARVGKFLLIPAVGYVAIVALLIANENRLVYPGSKYPKGNWNPIGFEFEEVNFKAADGTELVGWYLPKENATQTILHCHGNAENVAQVSRRLCDTMRERLNANVFVFDYRGFGKSEGSPEEAGVLLDAEAAIAWLNQKTNTTPADVIIFGQSLGGGPAVHLASTKGAKGLVLQRTFSSVVDAASRQYPWVPVHYLMKNRFPSDEKIKSYDGPLFQSHGDADKVVMYESGKALFEAAPGENKVFLTFDGAGHYTPFADSYWDALSDFLNAL